VSAPAVSAVGSPSVEPPAALGRTSALVVPAVDAALAGLAPSLLAPVRHHLAGGGKHIRAGLVLLSAAAAGGNDEDALPGAVAVELVHNYSLLHDDIIDGDKERRHRPTVWTQYGVGTAIVAGDALAALAVQVLLEVQTPERVRAAGLLAEANQAMIAGQASDMAFETRAAVSVDECLAMERGKTGALLAAACAIGALLGRGDDAKVDALGTFGEHLGISFQAVDDLLGIWGLPSVTGKPVGADLLARKKTLPVAAALASGGAAAAELQTILAGEPTPSEVARATELIEATGARQAVARIADEHLGVALSALERVDLVDAPKEDLAAVARFVTARDR
jgi:geranylgeranyl diphosphate synthase, type I